MNTETKILMSPIQVGAILVKREREKHRPDPAPTQTSLAYLGGC